MKNLTYLLIVIFFWSCSSKEPMIEESMESSSIEQSSDAIVDEVVATEEVAELTDEKTVESTKIIKQQLQESLNLILLSNKVKISEELNNQLTEAINDKVKSYSVNKAYDVIKITDVRIMAQDNLSEKQEITIGFNAETPYNKNLKGTATAVVSTNTVTIDEQDFVDYQVSFDSIDLK